SASDLSLPDRLLIVQTTFNPARLSSRAPFTVRVAVQDTAGFLVRDAAVQILGVPYSRVAVVPEKATGTDGTVTFTVHPLPGLAPAGAKSPVFFVRARNTKAQLIGGISTRRLVQLRTGPPA